MSSGASSLSVYGGLQYAHFRLDVYIQAYDDFLDRGRFSALPSNNNAEALYNTRNGLDRDTELCSNVHHQTQCGRSGVVQRSD